MLPIIAIVGRPNVGKSTLFNRITHSQKALVINEPGVTRDRQYQEAYYEDHHFIVVDTGGVGNAPENEIEENIYEQTQKAIDDADVVFFVVDARNGLVSADREIANLLRKQSKPIFLVMNKMDGLDSTIAGIDFYSLGFEHRFAVAASHNQGINALMAAAVLHFEPSTPKELEEEAELDVPAIAIVGRPNVGKSTLINRILGENRMIACDMPGTTRDSIYVDLERRGKHYILIDTAGVRKRKNVTELTEKFSAIKTMQSIREANVVLLVVDAQDGLTDQDLTLLDFSIKAGRGLMICINKWDAISREDRDEIKKQLTYRLNFAKFASVHFISALHGTGVGELFSRIDQVYKSARQSFSSSELTKLLEAALESHPPPLVSNRRIKLRFAHCGGQNPPTIVIHGNQTEDIPNSYERYLSNYFIKALKLEGTPVKLVFKTGENPYASKRNLLSKRQHLKRKRLMRFVKGA